jgi:hypothetical protein
VVALLATAGAVITRIIVPIARGDPAGMSLLKTSSWTMILPRMAGNLGGGAYPLHCALSNAEYEACWQQIF